MLDALDLVPAYIIILHIIYGLCSVKRFETVSFFSVFVYFPGFVAVSVFIDFIST